MIEFFSYPFFQRALLAGALAALLCGALSFFVVLRRLAFVGSGVAHAAFGGVAVATLFGFPPLAGGLVAALLVAGATARAQGSSVTEDSAVGVFTVAAMALGVVALGFVKTNVDLFGLMFGNILTVAPADLAVLGVAAAAASGEVIRCGGRARKSSAGYDLVRLFTGAEGTLGIITEATLRLHGRPEAVASAVYSYPELRGAVDTVVEVIQSGAPVARIEFLDEVQVRACNAYSKLSLPEAPTLFIEFHGTQAGVVEQIERATAVIASYGGTLFDQATDPQRREELWRARHRAYFAARALRPGCECVVADVCVPISGLAECVAQTRANIDRERLTAPIVGHVGDGNFHVLFLLAPGAADEWARMERVYDAMIAQAHRLGGTCTGEHGIGFGKRDKLVVEFGEPVVALMQSLKDAWDPRGILNPGKIFTRKIPG